MDGLVSLLQRGRRALLYASLVILTYLFHQRQWWPLLAAGGPPLDEAKKTKSDDDEKEKEKEQEGEREQGQGGVDRLHAGVEEVEEGKEKLEIREGIIVENSLVDERGLDQSGEEEEETGVVEGCLEANLEERRRVAKVVKKLKRGEYVSGEMEEKDDDGDEEGEEVVVEATVVQKEQNQQEHNLQMEQNFLGEETRTENEIVQDQPPHEEEDMIPGSNNKDFDDEQSLIVILLDNGSVRPEPTLTLRKVAAFLQASLKSQSIEAEVIPVSARYSDRVSEELLEGQKAVILQTALEKIKEEKRNVGRIVIQPFFLGPSATITEFAPTMLAKFFPPNLWRVSEPLVKIETDTATQQDPISELLTKKIRQTARLIIPDQSRYSVVLCDHGSPLLSVNRVRRALAARIRRLLGEEAFCVADCSMESRKGEEYSFNRPLLEEVFSRFSQNEHVILSLAFLCDGKHAGDDGDISNIIKDVLRARPDLHIYNTGSLLSIPEDDEILASLTTYLTQLSQRELCL